MAMSLKKIGAIAVGGAMVASALASGAMAATTSGDVSAFMKDAVKDGQPNVNIVVGENAATSDVVSASDIAAKIGSMCYKTGTVEDGSAEIKVSADAKSDDIDLWDDDEVKNGTKAITMVTSADSDYSKAFVADVADLVKDGKLLKMTKNATVDLGDLSTLTEVEDIDPLDWYDDDDHNAAEFLIGTLTPENSKDNFNDAKASADVDKNDLFWAAFNINDSEDSLTKSPAIKEGQLIPLLGQTKVLVKADEEDEILYLGDEAYSGVLKDGESFDVGNGYSVKINSVLKDTVAGGDTIYKVDVAILKDGTKVESMFKTAPDSLVYKDVGVHIEKAWTDVGEDYGYAELVITKNTQAIELGEEPIKDWEAWAVAIDSDDDKLALSKKFDNDNNGKLSVGVGKDDVIGIALKYVGDDEEDIDSDEKVSIAGYVDLEFDKDDDELNIFYSMDKSMEVTLDVGQKVKVLNAEVKLNDLKASAQEVMPVTAPIAKLDSEVTLDTADKNLILVGGPVVNKLAEALQTAGKITIDNTSPATLAVVGDAANGNDVLVVAGGDRDATRAAALDLIKDY